MTVEIFIFGTADYIVFFSMLVISATIGIYFGFFSKSNNTTNEYLLGGKKMPTLPIAISLVASQISGISIMTVPAESYSYGAAYIWNVFSVIIFIPILCIIIIPIFYKNNISNCYEYLEIRFNKCTRRLITFSFILNAILMLPVIIFVPTLAFTQVSGISSHLTNFIVCSICSMYTLLGGIKAVVWTDVVQGVIMLSSVSFVGIAGVNKSGGIGKIFEYASNGGRLDISYSLDPRIRSTAWNTFLGGAVFWIGYLGLNQSCVQRIVSLPTLGHARRALILAGIFFFIIVGLNISIGIVMFGYYHDCDPVKAGFVNKADKLMAFFVQDVLGNIKGMPGIFIACIFSAALSTMSAMLNSLAGVIYFDYIKPFIKHDEQKANFIMKTIIILMGIYCIIGGFIVEKFQSIFQIAQTIFGITAGALVGVFLLGILVPRVDGRTAVYSIIISFISLIWIIVNAHFRFISGILRYTPLPTIIDGCSTKFGMNYSMSILFNETKLHEITTIKSGITTAFKSDAPFSFFDISFYWYKVIGVLIVWIVAIPLSYFMPMNDKLDPKLFANCIQRFLPSKREGTYEETPLNLNHSK